MGPTTVSVIILNYNGWKHVEACLASLLDIDSPKPNLEIIVVDNASTDGSAEMIAEHFPQVRLIRSETNLGFSRGANLGAAHASGTHLAFLNNDMRVDRQWLAALIETANSDEPFACVGSVIMNWDNTGIDFAGRPTDAFCLSDESDPDERPSRPTAITYGLYISAGAALMRADAFRELGGFDPDYFMYHEDVDLCWRFWLRGYRCALSPKSIVYHRGGASSKKLPAADVHRMAQTHLLSTLFKNLETESLKDLLPLLLYYLLERGLWHQGARASTAEALNSFYEGLDNLLLKRADVQRTRAISDTELFSIVNHPFDFLLRQEPYQAIKRQLASRCVDVKFDLSPGSANEVRNAIQSWLGAAHFLFERSTIAAFEEKQEQLAAEMAQKKSKIQQLTDESDALAAELAARNAELSQIKRSFGWRILNRYGRIKYRYLMPLYRLLGIERKPPTPEPRQPMTPRDSGD